MFSLLAAVQPQQLSVMRRPTRQAAVSRLSQSPQSRPVCTSRKRLIQMQEATTTSTRRNYTTCTRSLQQRRRTRSPRKHPRHPLQRYLPPRPPHQLPHPHPQLPPAAFLNTGTRRAPRTKPLQKSSLDGSSKASSTESRRRTSSLLAPQFARSWSNASSSIVSRRLRSSGWTTTLQNQYRCWDWQPSERLSSRFPYERLTYWSTTTAPRPASSTKAPKL